MYCVFNATTLHSANQGSALGWPFEKQYGYFCDQRDSNLFILSNGLLNLLAIIAAYLLTVLYLGPKFMEKRKPLEIKSVIRLYNFSMILIDCYLMRRCLPLIDNGLYLLSRMAGFLDTIWFVLRKKQTHVTFLHVFHHAYVPTVAYVGSRWVPISPNGMSLPFFNGGIHVVMYSYYLLATFPALRQHLWWKRYLTGLQMAQFVIVLIYNVLGFFFFGKYCGNYQTGALVGSIISAAIFLVLFYLFYQRAYVKTDLQKCVPAERKAVKQHKM
jgi:hypothetical protein